MSENPKISATKACVFDAYGTLFDVHSAVGKHRARLGDVADQVSAVWRTKQLEYTWLRSLMGRHADFWQVTGDALDFAMATLNIRDAALRERLMQLYLEISAYPEVPSTLQRLQQAGMKLAVLSNGSPAMLSAAVGNARIDRYFDAVLSVEEVGVFKPHPSVYQLAVDRLGVAAGEICFLSSNGWDAFSAKAFGFNVLWCNRFGQPPENIPSLPDAEISDLSALPDYVIHPA